MSVCVFQACVKSMQDHLWNLWRCSLLYSAFLKTQLPFPRYSWTISAPVRDTCFYKIIFCNWEKYMTILQRRLVGIWLFVCQTSLWSALHHFAHQGALEHHFKTLIFKFQKLLKMVILSCINTIFLSGFCWLILWQGLLLNGNSFLYIRKKLNFTYLN